VVENLPVRTFTHKSLTIEGYSRAAVQTYWRLPELKLGFDLGGQPWSFMATPNWFVSHGHLDHIVALPAYVARRRLMKMDPPTLYMPEQIVDTVEKILRLYTRLDGGRMPCKLVPLQPGMEVELSRELVVTTFPTKHRVPSLGFVVWERRKKLKAEYQGLPGEQIRDLRLQGIEVTAESRIPRVAYLGDTAPEGLDAYPPIYDAEVLITEMTFVSPHHRKEKIHKFGHLHLDDLIERKDRFRNEVIIAAHFSTRLHDQQIRKQIEKRIPDLFGGRLQIWI